MWKFFKCSHKTFSPPMIRRRHDNVINRLQDTYVTCEQCREQFPYSLSEMRRVHERRRQREEAFEARVASAKSQIASSRARKEAAAQADLILPTGVTRPGPSMVLASKMKERRTSPRIPGQATPESITSLHKLAYFYHSQKNYQQAERLYLEALAASDTPEGRKDPEFEKLLNNLASVYQRTGKFQDAEFLYQRSLKMVEDQYGEYHPKIVRRLLNLAELYDEMNRSTESAQEYQRAMLIAERELGPLHADTQKVLRSYSAMLRKRNRPEDAAAVEGRLASMPSS